jgi:2-polyprenyl-3-methyl-5-hydroxy-6-metoxy-1,4-benzoquinol methylase
LTIRAANGWSGFFTSLRVGAILRPRSFYCQLSAGSAEGRVAMANGIDFHCRICGTAQHVKPRAVLRNNYKVVKCPKCTVACLQPIPSENELKQYYERYYLTRTRNDRQDDLVDLHRGVLQYLLHRSSHQAGISILDFGFGSGSFLKLVAKSKHRAFGTDLSEQNCQQLESYCKQNDLIITIVNLGEQSLADFGNINFDVITMFQIIEHLPDPVASLSALSSLQRSGGLIYVECPNNDALYLGIKNAVNKIIRRNEFCDSLKVPEHIFGFNKGSIKTMLANIGYEILDFGDYYYSDGLHQVESIYWWPSFPRNCVSGFPNTFVKSLIQCFDMLSSKIFHSGAGLYVLAEKKR